MMQQSLWHICYTDCGFLPSSAGGRHGRWRPVPSLSRMKAPFTNVSLSLSRGERAWLIVLKHGTLRLPCMLSRRTLQPTLLASSCSGLKHGVLNSDRVGTSEKMPGPYRVSFMPQFRNPADVELCYPVFEVIASILHRGPSVGSGHYVCMESGDPLWLLDDACTARECISADIARIPTDAPSGIVASRSSRRMRLGVRLG